TAPPRAAGALLPDARISPRRRGRPSGHAAGRLARPRRLRGPRLDPHLALPNPPQAGPQCASRPTPPAPGKVLWLEPYPDALLEGVIEVGPEGRYAQTEAISLAFVTALQLL